MPKHTRGHQRKGQSAPKPKTTTTPRVESKAPATPEIASPTLLSPHDRGLRLERKEWLVLAISLCIGFAAFKTSDAPLFFSCLGGAWLGFAYLSVSHSGRAIYRFLFLTAITAVLAAIALRAYDFKSPIPEPLLTSQLAELGNLQSFIGEKSEMELQEMFDLRPMVRFNVISVQTSLACSPLTPSERNQMNAFFEGGQAMISSKYANLSVPYKGRAEVRFIINDIPWIKTSQKYDVNREKLKQFEESGTLPSNVRDAVKSFEGALDKNIGIMLDVLNNEVRQDPYRIIYEDDTSSPYYLSVDTDYAGASEPLEPKRREISDQIRKYLNVQ